MKRLIILLTVFMLVVSIPFLAKAQKGSCDDEVQATGLSLSWDRSAETANWTLTADFKNYVEAMNDSTWSWDEYFNISVYGDPIRIYRFGFDLGMGTKYYYFTERDLRNNGYKFPIVSNIGFDEVNGAYPSQVRTNVSFDIFTISEADFSDLVLLERDVLPDKPDYWDLRNNFTINNLYSNFTNGYINFPTFNQDQESFLRTFVSDDIYVTGEDSGPYQGYCLGSLTPDLLVEEINDPFASMTCEWSLKDANEQNPVYSFCVGNNKEFNNLSVKYDCEGSTFGDLDCGGLVWQAIEHLQGGVNINLAASQNINGRWVSCHELRGLDLEEIKQVAMTRAATECSIDVAKLGLMFAGARYVPGTKLVRLGLSLNAIGDIKDLTSGDLDCINRAFEKSALYQGKVMLGADQLCTDDLQIFFDGSLPMPAPDDEYSEVSFNYCGQLPGSPSDFYDPRTQRGDCMQCIKSGLANGEMTKIYTAVGCIRVSGSGLAADLIILMLGISGGAALLSILAAAFLLTISRGDTNKVKEAKSLATAAITGLLFLIFSVIILNFIGVEILQIPGLG